MRVLLTLAVLAAGCERAAPPPAADAVFASVCARCHGADGFGSAAPDAGQGPRNFHDAAFQASRTDAQLRAAIVAGKNGSMPAFGAAFPDETLDGLVARIRSFHPPEVHR